MKKSILKRESIIILLLILNASMDLVCNYFCGSNILEGIKIFILFIVIIVLCIDLKKEIKYFNEEKLDNSRRNILTVMFVVDVSLNIIYKFIFNLIFLKYIQVFILSIGFILCLKIKD